METYRSLYFSYLKSSEVVEESGAAEDVTHVLTGDGSKAISDMDCWASDDWCSCWRLRIALVVGCHRDGRSGIWEKSHEKEKV